MKPEMVRRQEATAATVARFRAKSFSWSAGRTCVHLCRQHLKNMGHRPPTIPRFRSALTAKKALKSRGWGSVSDMLDSMLERIPPAFMTLGDIAVLPGEGGLDGITICAGPRRAFGWTEGEAEPTMMEPHTGKLIGAWRT